MGGFFGVVAKEDCVADLFFGTDYHSHLGTMRGGMAVLSDKGFQRAIHDISNSQFRTKFENDFRRFEGKAGIGIISDNEDQPLIISSHLGVYAISTVGVITNLQSLVKELYATHSVQFSEMSRGGVNPTELVATLINSQATLAEGVRYAQHKIEGSCSLVILTLDGVLYAARDRFGRTPVILAQKEGAVAAAMESCCFPNLGYTVSRELGPGEMVLCTPDGVETVLPAGDQMAICSFLWVYFGYPASAYEGRNVEMARYRCGGALARRNPVDADSVGGVPDSGVAHALGYAVEAGIRYARPFVKYTPTWPRSFMPPDQKARELIAQMKLIPIPGLIQGKRLIFCDDSIVRGTQLRDQVKRLYDDGAKEIHMRIACPPLLYQCRFLNFSRSKSEMDLATRRFIREIEGENADIAKYRDPDGSPYQDMVGRIRQRLGLYSLAYQRLDDLVEAIGLPREKLCTYCWTGEDVSKPNGCTHGCSRCPSQCAAGSAATAQ
ncbi:MAG TPA: amidophosphoribosyltransferase [Kiritimatiellia bacterium]|nr:amidophosphoribosyltransferase [Kiritimatiellia bacterium]HRU70327.1 amidophosphoribosyltransferase [Kiritimatiellia bacterium]